MTDEPELDMEALEQILAVGEGTVQGPDLSDLSPRGRERPSLSYKPELPNWAVEESNAEKKPRDGVACVTCPAAVWMTGGTDLEAFCLVLQARTWSTRDQVPMQIEICNAKETAILAKKGPTAPPQLTDQTGAQR